MKWVWIRPLVLQPQTKNVPNRTQKIGARAAYFSTTSGDSSSDTSPTPAAGGGDTARSP